MLLILQLSLLISNYLNKSALSMNPPSTIHPTLVSPLVNPTTPITTSVPLLGSSSPLLSNFLPVALLGGGSNIGITTPPITSSVLSSSSTSPTHPRKPREAPGKILVLTQMIYFK